MLGRIQLSLPVLTFGLITGGEKVTDEHELSGECVCLREEVHSGNEA